MSKLITYTIDMLNSVRKDCRIIYIDPKPSNILDSYGLGVEYIKKKAVEGVAEIVGELL